MSQSDVPEIPSERRQGSDRRKEPTTSRRDVKKPSRWVRWVGIAGRDVGIIVGALTAIVVSVFLMRPVYSDQPRVVQAITKRAPITQTVFGKPPAATPTKPAAPGDTTHRGKLVGTPEFERDRKAFAQALVNTKRVSPERADSIAYYAVREAYVNGIPPAVVFGVMLTENAKFISGAMSNVGAVGLMQVYPKIWLKELRSKFGADLASDSTNIKYGTYILRTYIKTDSGGVSARDLGKGLLRYNGCVTGSNTPNCKTYPSKVKRFVESLGGSICGAKSFYDCVAEPFLAGLFGKREQSAAGDVQVK